MVNKVPIPRCSICWRTHRISHPFLKLCLKQTPRKTGYSKLLGRNVPHAPCFLQPDVTASLLPTALATVSETPPPKKNAPPTHN
mmetsp:Transcript_147060/g.256757  ORF Transcript_147060/g.256757 Transcript_147060/m.256757 type:complete len:84 (-) Transcript_147060:206-457(-)